MIPKIINSSRQIEIEERSALSVLMALRKRFAKERKDPQIYNSEELWQILSRATSSVSQRKIMQILDEHNIEEKVTIINDKIVQGAIDRSKIFRINWTGIFGMSLTKVILKLRNEGKTKEETYDTIIKNKELQAIFKDNPRIEEKYSNNIKIDVNSRYVENQTAEKMKEKKE